VTLSSRPDAQPQPSEPSPRSAAPTSSEPPATLAPPRYVSFPASPPAVKALESEPFLYTVTGTNLSEVDPATLSSRWTIELPRPSDGFLHDMGNGSLCVEIKLTECISVNLATRTAGPTVQLPADMFDTQPVGDGRHIAMLHKKGLVTVMEVQTQVARSVQVVPWPPPWPLPPPSSDTGGTSLFGAGGHRVFVVGNDEAPDPVLSVVNTDTMAVTTTPWQRRSRPPHKLQTLYPFAPSPDGNILYAIRGQDLLVFDMESMALRHTFPQDSGLLNLRITPDGRYLYLLTSDGQLRVIEATTGRQVSTGHTSGHRPTHIVVLDRAREVAIPVEGGYDLFDMSAFVAS
jgi:hypothetical protein